MDFHKAIILGIFLPLAFQYCSEAHFVKMTNVICESFNKSWVVFHYCRLKAYSRNKTSLHLNATFLKPAGNISIRLRMLKKASGYKPFLFDYTFDACQFMRRRNQPFVNIIWKMIRNVSTVNHTCPFVGLQTVSDFHSIEVPVLLPTGDYLLIFNWMCDGKLQFQNHVYFTFVEDLVVKKSTQ